MGAKLVTSMEDHAQLSRCIDPEMFEGLQLVKISQSQLAKETIRRRRIGYKR